MNIFGTILLLGIVAFAVTLLVSTIRELIVRKRCKSGDDVSVNEVNNDKEKK